MHHYTGCGLSHIWLRNGYSTSVKGEGRSVNVEREAELRQEIGRALCTSLTLSSDELKYLRLTMSLTQDGLAKLMGWRSQAVASYENSGRVTKGYDRAVVLLFLSFLDGKVDVQRILRDFSVQGSLGQRRLVFQIEDAHWRLWQDERPVLVRQYA